jgi:predicted Fe-Mo cluster-binding NifX family protein
MVRVAVPIFRSRVSPVFDSSTRVIIIDVEHNKETKRDEIYLDKMSLVERVSVLQKSKVTTIVCGGISNVFRNMLEKGKIGLITGIAGKVDQVLVAYLSENLNDPKFHLSGLKLNH